MSRKRTTKDDEVSGNALTTLPPLPAGWCWAKVHEIGEVKLGRQRSPEHHHGKHMRPYLRVANVYEDRIDLSDVLEMNFTPEEFETYQLRHGDILLNEGQSLEWVGRPAMYRDDLPGACFQNTLVRFRTGPYLLPSFALLILRYYLHSQRFQKIAKWTVNIAHLGASRFAELEFPLPPKGEQARIVEKFEELFTKLDAGIANLKRVKVALKRYRATVLKAAVEGRLTEEWREKHPDVEPGSALLDRILTERRRQWEERQLARFAEAMQAPSKGWQAKYPEPVDPMLNRLPSLPMGWSWASVDQLIVYLRNGLSTKPTGTSDGHRILRINAVRPMKVNLDEVRFLSEEPSERDSYLIEDGDLLFTRYNGSVDLLGVVGMVRGCLEPTLHPDKLIRVKAADRNLSRFLEVACNVGVSRKHMGGRARTTAGQTGISGTDIREMPCPFPPHEEQVEIIREIERRLSVVNEIEAQVEANLKRASRLRRSILKRAFEGQLVPQDPADEPADRLLHRIRSERGVGEASENVIRKPLPSGRIQKDRDLPLFDRDGGVDER